MIIRKLLVILLIIVNFNCTQKRSDSKLKVIPCFYYWKTICRLDKKDIHYFKQMEIKKIYIRLFDLIWNKHSREPMPAGKLLCNQKTQSYDTMIPVIFITQDVLRNTQYNQIKILAKNIINEIIIYKKLLKIKSYSEIQIDCDWTRNMKEKYFKLLEELKICSKNRIESIIWSTTIRLHQVKYYKKTGIPPVDRGALMIYNTSSPMQFSKKNSILDLDTVKLYLDHIDEYPLPLDIALPIFSWVMQYDSYKQFIRLFSEVSKQDMKKHNDFKSRGENIFIAKRDTYLNRKRIMQGDIIKVDEIKMKDCFKLIDYLKIKLNIEKLSVILYHYDRSIIRGVTDDRSEKIKKIFYYF